MLKIALLGIAGTLLALQLKSLKSDYAIYLILGVSLVIFHGVADQLSLILSGLASLRSSLPIQGSYLQVLLKIVGITYVRSLRRICVGTPGFRRWQARSRSLESWQCFHLVSRS